jgi:hypothetical protein
MRIDAAPTGAAIFALMVMLSISSPAHAQSGSPPTRLDTMKVTETASSRVANGRDAFDERRLRGFRHFYDSTELRKRSVAHLNDLLQGEQSMAVVRPPLCTAPGNKTNPDVHHYNCVSSAATRIAVTRGLCAMKVLLDGTMLGVGGEIDIRDQGFDRRHNWMTALDLNTIDLGGMEKIEVYRRSDEIPLELKGVDTECGLIVLWSRR